jgi:hypothetical protein
LRNERLGHWPSARTELDDRAWPRRIDIGCHGAGERAARRRDRAGRQRLFDPGADEADFVVEANAVPLLETANVDLELLLVGLKLLLEPAPVTLELLLDLSFESTLLAFEDLDMPLDFPSQSVRLQFEEALLFLELAFDELKGWERHIWG